MSKQGFVVYYRVSTDKQGRSGLGLDAQRATVETYLGGARILAEFKEVESGKLDKRPALERALRSAKLHRAPLLVAKVDRLTRSVAFLSRLLESGVEVRFCDLPQVEGPAGKFMLNQMVAVAELEAGLISARTKAALAAAKARGTKLGGFRGWKIGRTAAIAGRAAGTARANARAAELEPIVMEIRQSGITSACGLAKAFNERGIPASRGGLWRAHQTGRLMDRLDL